MVRKKSGFGFRPWHLISQTHQDEGGPRGMALMVRHDCPLGTCVSTTQEIEIEIEQLDIGGAYFLRTD